ncbi:MAG: ligand-binding sensor domain-containing protein, partial [Bacteroidota bacterium]
MKLVRILILLGFISTQALVYGQSRELKANFDLEHISARHGLSQGVVNTIMQDHNGFIWFGTKDGLNRYDGEEIRIYSHCHEDTTGISNSHILSLEEDSSGTIWVGTNGGGLNKFDPETETFSTITLNAEKEENGYPTERVEHMKLVSERYLLISTYRQGLYVLDLETDEKKNYYLNKKDSAETAPSYIRDIATDEKGNIYLAMGHDGIAQFDIETGEFEILVDQKHKDTQKTLNEYFSVHKKGNKLWLSNYAIGLESYNLQTKEIKQYSSVEIVKNGVILSQKIVDITDKDSLLWFATSMGIFAFHPENEEFKHFSKPEENISRHEFAIGVRELYKDKNNELWLGTNGYGAYFFANKTKYFFTVNNYPYSTDKPHPSVRSLYKQGDSLLANTYDGIILYDLQTMQHELILPDMNIYTIAPEPHDKRILWIGDEGSGLYKLDRLSLHLDTIPASNKKEKGKLLGSTVFSLLHDGDYLWVGTQKALNRYNKNTGDIKYYEHDNMDPKSINYGQVFSLYKQGPERLWVGTDNGGLGIFNPKTGNVQRFAYDHQDSNSLGHNRVYSVYEDSNGNIWVATSGGLNKFISEEEGFKRYTKDDGLPNNVVYAILEDRSGNLWLSTNLGLSEFNPRMETFRNFNIDDGLQENEFNASAYFKSPDGQMFFGGIQGFTSFYPEEIKLNQFKPEVVFTQLVLKNQPGIIEKPITNKNKIRLSHDNAFFDIRFVALNYYQAEKNQYKYRLKRPDSKTTEWIDLQNENHISFFGIEPGEYTLEVKGSNNDGVWSDRSKSIEITIVPPFWKTPFFRISLILLVLVLITLVVLQRMRNMRKQRDKLKTIVDAKTSDLKQTNKSLKNEIQERKKTEEQLLEANRTKDKFFSIIGHDLKNPLSAVFSLSKILDEDYEQISEEEKRNVIKNILESSQNAFRLTENILNWARTQVGQMKLDIEDINLFKQIQENIQLYKSEERKKEISLTNNVDKSLFVSADQNMLSAILRNLISNAIKFTPRGGEISFSARENGQFVEITIEDNGIGMDKKTQQSLFEIKPGSSSFGTDNEPGTGLGMLITKEFVDSHGGRIAVDSEPGKGT